MNDNGLGVGGRHKRMEIGQETQRRGDRLGWGGRHRGVEMGWNAEADRFRKKELNWVHTKRQSPQA